MMMFLTAIVENVNVTKIRGRMTNKVCTKKKK